MVHTKGMRKNVQRYNKKCTYASKVGIIFEMIDKIYPIRLL